MASCVSVCQLHCNNYVHALCKKAQEILEYLTRDVLKDAAFQMVCRMISEGCDSSRILENAGFFPRIVEAYMARQFIGVLLENIAL